MWYIVFVVPSFKSKALLYSQDLLLWEFACFNIVSCQYFNRLTILPKPSSTQLKSMLGCINSLTCVTRRFQIFDATICRCDVTQSQSWTLVDSLHLWVISAIVSCNQHRVHSMGVDDPSVS